MTGGSAITLILLAGAGAVVLSRRVPWRGKILFLFVVAYLLVGGELVTALLRAA